MVAELNDTIIKAAAEVVALLLGIITTVIIPYAVLLFRAWAKAKIAEARAKIEAIESTEVREGLESALTRLDLTAATVVADIEATMKKYSEEGKPLNPAKLKEQAEIRIRNRIDPASAKMLQERLGQERFGKLIASKVEQKALELKMDKAAGCKD